MSEKKNDGLPEESTVFSAPPEHNDRKESFFKKRAVKIIGIILCLLVIAGAGYVVLEVIPDKDKKLKSEINTVTISCDINTVQSVLRTTGQEEIRFYPEKNTDSASSERKYNWYIEGIEKEKIETVATNNYVEKVTELKAVKQEKEEDSAYGFENPECVITVSGSEKNYKIELGNAIGVERYARFSGDVTGVYIITENDSSLLTSDTLKFASLSSYQMAKFSDNASAYKNSGGKLERFDSIVLSGKNYPETLVFGMNNDALLSETFPYTVKSPREEVAKNADLLFGLFTGSLGVDGAYSFNDDAESLAKYGLDNPDISVALNVGGEQKWFKFNKTDNSHYAAVNDSLHMIRIVSADSLPFADLKTSDYYDETLVRYSLSDISLIKVSRNGTERTFTVAAAESGTVSVSENGKVIEGFGDFFKQFKEINAKHKDFADMGGAETVFTFILSDGRTVSLSFKKTDKTVCYAQTGNRYEEISLTAYNKLLDSYDKLS